THALHLLKQQRNVIDALRENNRYRIHPQSLTQSGICLQIWANGALQHELTHKKKWEEIWNARFPILEKALENLSISSVSICSADQAKAALKGQIDALIVSNGNAAIDAWDKQPDPEGDPDTVENACIDKKIQEICKLSPDKANPCSECK